MSVFRVFMASVLTLAVVGAAAPVAAAPTRIPDHAMLQAADLGGAKPGDADGDSWPALRPPRPCGVTDPDPVAERAVTAVIDVDQAPVAVLEYVALLRPGGARAYLRELRRALRHCTDRDWRLVAADRDSLVLRWTQRWDHVGDQVTHHTFVVVAQTGPAIVLVADTGWETSSGDRELAENLITPAVRRAAALH